MANELAILEEGRKRWGSGILLGHDSTTVEDISEYVRYKTVEYRTTDLKDNDLWEVFQEDFTGFTTEIFKSCIPADIRNLRRLLRKNGVWVIKDRHVLVAQSLFNTLQEEEPTAWTTEAITTHLADDGGFNSVKLEPIVQDILSPITTPDKKNPSQILSPTHGASLQSRAPTPFLQMPPRRPSSTKAPTPIPPPVASPIPLTPLPDKLFSLTRDSTPVPQASRHRGLPLPNRGNPLQDPQGQTGQEYESRWEFGRGTGDRLNEENNEFHENPRDDNRFRYENPGNRSGESPNERFDKTEQNFFKGLGNLVKLYTDEEKYSGGNDNFDQKLLIFNDNCDAAGILPSMRHRAYPRMLRGLAKDHYFSNLQKSPQKLNLEQLCVATRNYFEGEEYRRRMLEKWNTLTLRKVISRPENSSKTTTECLELLILELRRIQYGLDPDLRTEKLLHNKMINACRDLPACKPACFKAPTSLAGLFDDLREAISIYEPSENSEVHFTDRRYYKQPPPLNISSPRTKTYNSEKRPRTDLPRRQTTSKKRCFVCNREGCWSNKHSQEEQEESKQQYAKEMYNNYKNYKKNPRQYVMEYEGEENDDEYSSEPEEEPADNTAQALIIDTTPPNESSLQEQTELFLTSFGDVAPQTALRITNSLADQLFIHAITGVNPTNTFNPKNQTVKLGNNTSLTTLEATTDPTTSENPETDPFTYITTTRYTEEIFYGIVVDTGASQRSTAGYGQVRAYQKYHPATINTTRAGLVKVQFGIGTTTSIGSVTIQTPIGHVEFHVVQADTPFLLCLADMDKLEVYYNNLTNKLVTPKGTVPVI